MKGMKGYSRENFAQHTGNHPDASNTRTLTCNKQNAEHVKQPHSVRCYGTDIHKCNVRSSRKLTSTFKRMNVNVKAEVHY
jgi:hypothetical protein